MSDKQKLQIEEAHQKLADLTETMQREKVELTPEIKAYIDENVRKIKFKLQQKEPIYPSNLEFIQSIVDWIDLPEDYKKKYQSVEALTTSDFYKEANKREFSLKQWADLIHLAMVIGEDVSWLDFNFNYEKGKIVCDRPLYLYGSTKLTGLPAGLKVRGDLDLNGCTGLTELSVGLDVGGYLFLFGCTGLTKLPEGLMVGKDLDLEGCTGLTELPEGLKVGTVLHLSEDLNEQVKEDAERLQKQGNINEIKYV